MNENLIDAIQYASTHQEQFLASLKTFGSMASVSTDLNLKSEMVRTAQWIANHFAEVGLKNIQIMPTQGHPVVYAEDLGAGPAMPTVLIYGHYDVQPAEPLELWVTNPFNPTIRGDYIYGRGMTDMKGQVMASINAVEAVIQTGKLPINIKFLIEGEEEIGSPSLVEFLKNHKDLFSCDLALNMDSGMISPDHPTITYALRGLAYFEIRIYGPQYDLHSGVFGGTVHNPAQALCEIIAGMHDENGRITLPGFYDRVRELSQEERHELARLPIDGTYFLEQTGAPALWGEAGFTPIERATARPTLDVNGLYSGFISEGSKTILPSSAMAKISMRLVPDQQPDEVHQQLLDYLKQKMPPTVRYEVSVMAGSPAAISDGRSSGVKALSKAMQSIWGIPPYFKREGGSVPVVTYFKEIIGVESVNTGFSMSNDNMHGPNEQLHLPTWHLGTQALIHFLHNMAEAA
jgi:acetylornithine deacetylase/succinyl-diaminopimelate desuccinylase-like protein